MRAVYHGGKSETMKLETLQRNAAKACRTHGHSMKWGQAYGTPLHQSKNADCRRCGAFVSVHVLPYPNEISIGGSAVAVGCKQPAAAQEQGS